MAQERDQGRLHQGDSAGISCEAAAGFAEGRGSDIWAKANHHCGWVPLVAETQFI